MQITTKLGVLAAACAMAGLIALGVSIRSNVDKPVIAAAKADASAARGVIVAVQHARTVEHQVAINDAAAATDYQRGIDDGKIDLQWAIDRLGAALRLRDKQLAAARAGNLSATSAGANRRDASAPADFLAAHGADAERLAAEADDVVRQLTACQAILENDRHGLTGQ